MANKKQKGGEKYLGPWVDVTFPEKHKGKRIWDVPLKDLKDVTKKRIKRRVKKIKKKIGETTLKDIAKLTSPIAPIKAADKILRKVSKKIKKGKKKAAPPKQTMKKFQSGGFLEPRIPNLDTM